MPPKHPVVGVIALVPDAWGSRWFPRHHVMSRLSRFFPVVWINPRHQRQNLLTVALRRVRNWRAEGGAPSTPDLDIVEPALWLPELYRPRWLADLTLRLLLERAAARLRRRGVNRVVLYVWHPHFHRAPEVFHADRLLYHIDDEYSFADQEVPNSPEEIQLIRQADQVIVHSPRLMHKKGMINPHTALVPNGVDFAAFTASWPEPADLAGIPRPRAGYTGALKKHLDWDLLDRVTADHPHVSFVFIGDRERHPEIDGPIERVRARPNVHFLGVRRSPEIPAYVAHCDVCLMPYRRMAYTDYIYPMKLHEYLAAGKPVLATPIPALEDFAAVIRLEATAEGWRAGLADALSSTANTAEVQARRRAVASDFDWDALVGRIAALILQRLDGQPAAR